MRIKPTYVIIVTVLALILASCNCGVPMKVKTIQTGDKTLNCKDIILEINEAEFYRKEAYTTQSISYDEALMPSCWVSGYFDSKSAIKAADARINYLSNIYDLLECGGKQNAADAPQAVVPGMPPFMAPVAPMAPGGYPAMVPTPYGVPMGVPPAQTPIEGMETPPESLSEGVDKIAPDEVLNHIHMRKDNSRYMHSHEHDGAHFHAPDGSVVQGGQ